ncbi:MAG: hypothetical protein R6U52_01445 [Kosmotogaceae bacterium]
MIKEKMDEDDRTKRRLKEFEKIKNTGTSTEFDSGYQKAVTDLLKFIKKQKQQRKKIYTLNNVSVSPKIALSILTEIIKNIEKKFLKKKGDR